MAQAQARTLDFTEPPKFKNGRQKSLSKKQLRARARRKVAKGKKPLEEMMLLYKPVEEWDDEELARGRPRASDGTFSGRPPEWVSRAVFEQALDRFNQIVQGKVRAEAAGAIDIVKQLLHDDRYDDKGKPLVPASVKLDAAKWLTEHVIGKPKQRVEADISVKLQAVLAQSVFTPGAPAALMGPVEQVIRSTPDTSDVWDVEGVEDDD